MAADGKSDHQKPQKFVVVGIVTSEDFQKCRYAVTKLYNSFPKEFDVPEIRPMLDVEWSQFITKYRRRLGNGLWSIKNNVAIFKNGIFLGDFHNLNEFIWKKWRFVFRQDWQHLAQKQLIEYLEEKTRQFRQLAYLTIAINKRVVGSLLFELYSDIVPLACENFMNRCRDEVDGYEGTPIHRVVKNSWIQCGGHDLDPVKIPCENYVVPHDRRGVLAMCNNRPHKDNSTQFYITLESTPWMNYNFVAFGQLLQGEEILKAIENVPTYYQAPLQDITIVKCGEYPTRFNPYSGTLYTADEIDQWKDIQQQSDILSYLKFYHHVIPGEGQADSSTSFKPLEYLGSTDSILIPDQIKTGKYSLKSDTKSYGKFWHLPEIYDELAEGSDFDICDKPSSFLMTFKTPLYDYDHSPRTSDMTL